MSTVNLGRVQGGGFFASTSTNTTLIPKSTIETTAGVDVSPLVGDVIVNANGDLLLIKSISTASYTTTKFGSIKGAKGDKGDKGDSGSGGGNIGSYWAVIPNFSIPTHFGNAFISFSFTTNNGYDKSLIGAELKDILLASSVNIYKTQTDYAYQEMDMSELHSHIYNGDGTADGKQIIKGKAALDNGGMKDYDCLLFVYESGTDVYLTIGLVAEDKNSVYMSRDVHLDESMSFPTAGFFIGNS